jgi:hypothetical protein
MRKSKLCSVFYHVLEHIDRRYLDHMTMPVALVSERIPRYAQAIRDKGAYFEHCWGFLDATCRRICRPRVAQKAFYNGYKKWHCIKLQAVVTPDGLAPHIYGPIEGSRHDMHIVHRSNLIPFMAANAPFNEGFYLYADKGYTQSPQLIGSFKGDLSAEHEALNRNMSALRITVEWYFGRVSSLWAYTDMRKQMKIGQTPVGQIYRVSCFLTNIRTILTGRNEISDYFSCVPPSLDEYLP